MSLQTVPGFESLLRPYLYRVCSLLQVRSYWRVNFAQSTNEVRILSADSVSSRDGLAQAPRRAIEVIPSCILLYTTSLSGDRQ